MIHGSLQNQIIQEHSRALLPVVGSKLFFSLQRIYSSQWPMKQISLSILFGSLQYYDNLNKVISMLSSTQAKKDSKSRGKGSKPTTPSRPDREQRKDSIIQQRLKKELNSKFGKVTRKDEINQTNPIQRRKSNHSILTHNPLTKSSFSVNDAITHKSSLKPLLIGPRSASKPVLSSRRQITASFRERYSSADNNHFLTIKADNYSREPPLQPALSAREVSSRSTPSVTLAANLQARNNKFKLLFREKNIQRKTVSERKLSKLDSKISVLEEKKSYLKGLMPKEKAKVVVNRPKPRGQVVKKEKIMSLALSLIKYIELYFNMYQYDNIVGGHLKKIEGYSPKIKNIIMTDEVRARRITHIEDITSFFWSYRPASDRPEYFGEEDLSLYNLLNGYLLKMEKKYSETLIRFNKFQSQKRSSQKQIVEESKKKFESHQGKHHKIDQINKFVEERVRFDQGRREEYMSRLEKRGVTLNIIERSRQMILREKELAMKLALKGGDHQ